MFLWRFNVITFAWFRGDFIRYGIFQLEAKLLIYTNYFRSTDYAQVWRVGAGIECGLINYWGDWMMGRQQKHIEI